MENFADINWALLAPFIIIQFVLMIIALIDWLKTDSFNGSKGLWLVLIIFISYLGPIAYFIFGRRK